MAGRLRTANGRRPLAKASLIKMCPRLAACEPPRTLAEAAGDVRDEQLLGRYDKQLLRARTESAGFAAATTNQPMTASPAEETPLAPVRPASAASRSRNGFLRTIFYDFVLYWRIEATSRKQRCRMQRPTGAALILGLALWSLFPSDGRISETLIGKLLLLMLLSYLFLFRGSAALRAETRGHVWPGRT